MKKLLTTLSLFFLIIHATDALEVTYRITFQGNFTPEMQPSATFPANPHFSPIVIATHNSNYDMFPLGKLATKGVQNVAERGRANQLLRELTQESNQNHILHFHRSSSSFDGENSVHLNISANEKNPYLSVISMLAPSPDWIVGISKFSLVENGYFLTRKVIPLYPIDAGTDSGKDYTSRDIITSPQETIHTLKQINGERIQAPYAYLILEKI